METNRNTQNPVENVLNGFYKNAAVGADSITSLIDAVDNQEFRKALTDQREYYEQQKRDITIQMAEVYQKPVEQGMLAKLCSDMTIKMHSIGGLTVPDAAKLMVEGTNMGMIQLHQVLNGNPNVPEDLKRQGRHILAREQQYLNRITPYL